MTRKELIKQAVLRMDEVTPEGSLNIIVDGFTDGSDSNPLYALVDGVVDDCALEVFSAAPYWRLPQTAFTDEDIDFEQVNGRYVIRLRLPDAFLRVAEINCTSFKRPITEVVSEQSAEGKRQHNQYLMGKEHKPVGVLSFGKWGNTNCREIDCYSLAASIEKSAIAASYIAKPTIAASGDISFPDTLLPALEWLIAARAFGARGDAGHLEICQKNAQNLLI